MNAQYNICLNIGGVAQKGAAMNRNKGNKMSVEQGIIALKNRAQKDGVELKHFRLAKMWLPDEDETIHRLDGTVEPLSLDLHGCNCTDVTPEPTNAPASRAYEHD